MKFELIPKFFEILLKGYSKKDLISDCSAGIIVGIIALPLSIAFAIASGVSPEQGLITAIIAGFIISFLGGSKVQIGGPTGAFVVIIYGIIEKYGYEGLAVAGMLAGILLVLFGLFKFGNVIKFISYPVVVGFTTGIAVIILTSQIKDFFGLTIEDLPAEFIDKVHVLVTHFDSLNFYALALGIGTIMVSILWSKKFKKIPGSLIAIFATTILAVVMDLPVETIGSRFGSVPNSLPAPHLPNLSFELIQKMFFPALTIALLAGIESLLSAVVADGMTGDKHNSNTELVAQGVANFISPLFGGIPATGAIARTAANIKNGGKTPIAGIVHAVSVLLIMILFGKYAALIPMATLAGILVIVAYNMSEYKHFIKLFSSPKSDVFVLFSTFLLTVFADLTIAIQFGVVMSAFLFMKRMADVTDSTFLKRELYHQDEELVLSGVKSEDIPNEMEIFEVNGPFFFGTATLFKDVLHQVEENPKVLILRMRKVPAIDATGISALEWIIDAARREGSLLLISGMKEQPHRAIVKAGLIQKIKEENIVVTIDEAVKKGCDYLNSICT
jgi:SulP family sulfate permease